MARNFRTIKIRLYDEDRQKLEDFGLYLVPTGYQHGTEYLLAFREPHVLVRRVRDLEQALERVGEHIEGGNLDAALNIVAASGEEPNGA